MRGDGGRARAGGCAEGAAEGGRQGGGQLGSGALGGKVKALVYRNTKHTIPRWVPLHDKEPRGLAYETDTHFVHIFGKDYGLWVISPGLTCTQQKNGSLRDWVKQTFGAKTIKKTQLEIGHTIEGVWRPGLYFNVEVLHGLAATNEELRLAEQALLLLVQRLDELLNYVEPTTESLRGYSNKSRELLILSCTEVENYWTYYMHLADKSPPGGGQFTTNDYVKLCLPLSLAEYEVSLPRYSVIRPLKPFSGWKAQPSPTRTIPWYDAYNKTKHDRRNHFSDATIRSCIEAVAANLVLFAVRFGPFHLFQGAGTLAAYVNQLFALELKRPDPTSFYVPRITIPNNQSNDLVCYGAQDSVEPWAVDKLTI